MEVILLESFDKLGQIGDVVKVKNGFARNYLIPNKKALRANKANKEVFQNIKSDLIEKNKKFIDESKATLKKIENKEIVFIRNASDNGQLYGSVSPKDISNYFLENKLNVRPSNINLHSSIKKIGIYDLNIKLHAEVGCSLKINVAVSEEAAKQQKLEIEKESKKAKEIIPNSNVEKTSDGVKKIVDKNKDNIPNKDALDTNKKTEPITKEKTPEFDSLQKKESDPKDNSEKIRKKAEINKKEDNTTN